MMPGGKVKRRLDAVMYSRKRSGTVAAALLLVGAVVICGGILVISLRIRPTLMSMAVASTTDTVKELLSSAVCAVLSEQPQMYEQLVSIHSNQDGSVAALVTNVSKINSLQSEITVTVLEFLSNRSAAVVKIPAGNLTGISMFSGSGPNIPVKILSVTSVNTDFKNEFSSAGINQTRHQILMNVYVSLNILIPGHSTSVTVTTVVPVAETIIVGRVPDTFADIGDIAGGTQ